jgi:hypothetical protein
MRAREAFFHVYLALVAAVIVGLGIDLFPFLLWAVGVVVAVLTLGLVVQVAIQRRREKGCGDDSFADALSESLIRLRVASANILARLLSTIASVTVGSVAIFGSGQVYLARHGCPTSCQGVRSNWQWVLDVSGLVAAAGALTLAYAFPRVRGRMEKDAELREICINAAIPFAEALGLSPPELTVHIWEIRGVKGLRHLVRRAAFRLHDFEPASVIWRKGKGALGVCWKRERPYVVDIAVPDQAEDEQAFCALPEAERLGLTWSEFERLRHYRSTLVVPLRRHPGSALWGILSVSSLVDGKVSDLVALNNSQRFKDVLSICKAAVA